MDNGQYDIGDWVRSHTAGELGEKQIGDNVCLMGWVHRRRDHGQVVFVDLRDRFGISQVVFDPSVAPGVIEAANSLRNEFVIAVKGDVIAREKELVNDNLATGKIEIHAKEIKVLSKANTPPFTINQDEKLTASEALRLKYRYLDLRRPSLNETLVKRTQFVRAFRNALENQLFLDIETPYLYKSTPEGAREFIVPSRIQPGHFYALPQSPQLFKQLLMISGFDRYYQVVKCFRDEDLRADRQPEFTQIDIEMSFVNQEQVMQTIESVVKDTLENFCKLTLPPVRRMSFDEAMEKYGVDKPDLRFALELQDISSHVADCEFRVFKDAIQTEGIVNVLRVPGGADKITRKDIDNLTTTAESHGAKGLAWAKVTQDSGVESWQSPIAKFVGEQTINEINQHIAAEPGDVLFFSAGPFLQTKAILGAVRLHLAEILNLIDHTRFEFVWIVDFPLFEQEGTRFIARHHPFAMPSQQDQHLLDSHPADVRAAAYDLVLNGHEIAGGSIRNHNPEMQMQVFKLIGLSEEEAHEKFGFLLDALGFGAPPHGGIAFGLDRFLMCLLNTEAIRDVIPFPKSQKASCLMTSSPGKVSLDELREMHIRVQLPKI